MHVDDADGLFADPRPAQSPVTPTDPDALPEWLVSSLRRSLDELGLKSMSDRQAVIIELAGRPVATLRELTYGEARQISDKLAERTRQRGSTTTGRSAWDEREGDTWIDRL